MRSLGITSPMIPKNKARRWTRKYIKQTVSISAYVAAGNFSVYYTFILRAVRVFVFCVQIAYERKKKRKKWIGGWFRIDNFDISSPEFYTILSSFRRYWYIPNAPQVKRKIIRWKFQGNWRLSKIWIYNCERF